ncbi:hypothetical protein [Saccharolobus caldissimus]|nr:hypothetical protein [Saccharolobus caldissimus]
MYTHPYSGFLPNFQSELEEAKLTDGLQAQGSQRPTPQSDLCNTDLTNMFYIRWLRVNYAVKDIDEELSKIGLIVRFEGIAVGWTIIPTVVVLLVTVVLIMWLIVVTVF